MQCAPAWPWHELIFVDRCRRFPDPTETPSANNVIELNHIKDYGQCAEQPICNVSGASGNNGQPGADPGCIYFFDGPLCCYGQRVTYNFCHVTTGGFKGLYIDGTSSGVSTFGNVLWNVTGNIIVSLSTQPHRSLFAPLRPHHCFTEHTPSRKA